MKKTPISVAIVEDVQGTRENLEELLKRTPDLKCAGIYASGEDALRNLPKIAPDVVLMDINLPGMTGVQCTAELKAVLPKTLILMLTAYENSDLIFESLRSGASGYLMKNTEPDEIIQAIEQVCAGGSPMSMQIARKVVNHFQLIKKPSVEFEQLTVRENEILSLLAKGFLYKEIAAQLQISLHTVRGHVHLVYEKLHVQSRSEAIIKFLGQKG
jgi:DNA-binding NarL/FixJ family response regulator